MTTDADDRANDEADRHAEMIQKQRKSERVSSVDPVIDWTTANYALEQSAARIKQKGLKAVNNQTIDNECDRKQSVNMQFWYSIKQVVFVITCAAIVIYTLIHFT